MSKVINSIKNGNRSLLAVLHAMVQFLNELAERRKGSGYELLLEMIKYIERVTVISHQAAEKQLLISRLLERCPNTAPLLVLLKAQHRHDGEEIKMLKGALSKYRAVGLEGIPEFQRIVSEYINLKQNGMAIEEGKVIPLAEQYFTELDWFEIEEAISESGKSCESSSDGIRKLFDQLSDFHSLRSMLDVDGG